MVAGDVRLGRQAPDDQRLGLADLGPHPGGRRGRRGVPRGHGRRGHGLAFPAGDVDGGHPVAIGRVVPDPGVLVFERARVVAQDRDPGQPLERAAALGPVDVETDRQVVGVAGVLRVVPTDDDLGVARVGGDARGRIGSDVANRGPGREGVAGRRAVIVGEHDPVVVGRARCRGRIGVETTENLGDILEEQAHHAAGEGVGAEAPEHLGLVGGADGGPNEVDDIGHADQGQGRVADRGHGRNGQLLECATRCRPFDGEPAELGRLIEDVDEHRVGDRDQHDGVLRRRRLLPPRRLRREGRGHEAERREVSGERSDRIPPYHSGIV